VPLIGRLARGEHNAVVVQMAKVVLITVAVAEKILGSAYKG
jgi:hypothetical protein